RRTPALCGRHRSRGEGAAPPRPLGPAVPARPAPPGMDGGSTTPGGGRTGREGAAAAAQRRELSNLHLDPLTSRMISIPVTVTVTAFSLPRPPNCLPSADLPRGIPALFGYELFRGETLHTDIYEERMCPHAVVAQPQTPRGAVVTALLPSCTPVTQPFSTQMPRVQEVSHGHTFRPLLERLLGHREVAPEVLPEVLPTFVPLRWVPLGPQGQLPVPELSRLQTGARGAFGKPQGTVARVHIGQVIMSIRTKLQNKEHVIEALRRAKFKFPGRQKIHISKKWGFTKFNADEFENMVAEKWLIPDGCGVKYIPNRGPLDKWRALHS
ncbi:hypothetical protein EI555_021388, partial [Monodon monoceros]